MYMIAIVTVLLLSLPRACFEASMVLRLVSCFAMQVSRQALPRGQMHQLTPVQLLTKIYIGLLLQSVAA